MNETRGNVVCERATLARNPLARMRGLLGRAELPPGDGMLISPAPSIHSAFMRFDFDAVFLDRDLKVVRLDERIRPWRVRTAKHARSVLELASGEIHLRGLEPGDQLVIGGDAAAVPAQRPQQTTEI